MTVLFFGGGYIFSYIKSEKFDSIFVTLRREHKKTLEEKGHKVVGCFEEEYDQLEVSTFADNYLRYSFDSDRFLFHYSFEKRREILGKEISFWRRILDTYKPNIVVNEVVAMELTEVMYLEATARRIPYQAFMFGSLPDTMRWLDNPFNTLIEPQRLQEVLVSEEHKKQAEEFIIRARENYIKPFYLSKNSHSKVRRILAYSRFYLKESIKLASTKQFHYENYKEQARELLKCSVGDLLYKHNKLEFNDQYEYIYFPLHFEPEASLVYFAEFFSDQAEVIAHIAHSLKHNQLLIVKEYPSQPGKLLTGRFREIRKKYSNVLFIKGDAPSYEILQKAKFVVTISGSGGFEALILKKPTIVLGDVHYTACKAATKCNSYQELKYIIRNDLYNIPTDNDLKDYLSRLIALGLSGHPYSANGAFKSENVEAFTRQIEEVLQK